MKELPLSGKTYFLGEFPPTVGRKLIVGYSLSALNKAHSYAKNEDCMTELMSYVSVEVDGEMVALGTQELINQHVPDWFTLVQIEFETIKHNSIFMQDTDLFTLVKTQLKLVLKDMIDEHMKETAADAPTENLSKLV